MTSRFGGWRLWWLLPAVFAFVSPAFAQTPDDEFRSALAALPEASFADKETIAERLITGGHPAAGPTITA